MYSLIHITGAGLYGGLVQRCGLCTSLFANYEELQKHECPARAQSGNDHDNARGNDQKFACEYCTKCFLLPSQLRKHMRAHTLEKPYMCALCGVSFAESRYLTKHLKVHAAEKPYICEECGQAFAQKTSLDKHMAIHKKK